MSRMMKLALAACLVLVLASSVRAEPIAVKVVDVAGGAVYLTPGRSAGIVPKTKIRLRGVDAVVVEVTEKTAVIQIAGDAARIAIGDAGTADVTPEAVGDGPRLAKPRPPEASRDQWSDPVPPATQQTPRSVPLGVGEQRRGDVHLAVIGHGFVTTGRGNSDGDFEGRVIASFDAMHTLGTARALAADLDLGLRAFGGGFDASTRTPVLVRTAQLRYGAAADPVFAIGRLPFAAASVGPLDGGRARAQLGSFEIAAFGGIVPDPLSNKIDPAAARFGGEVTYDDPEAAWQPRVSLTAYGSTWNGAVDERRLAATASAARGPLALDGWAEAQSFAADNPWAAPAVQLTGAGATAQWSEHGIHAGLDLTFLRPDRSMRLAAALPPEWLCTLAPAMGMTGTGVAERCMGDTWWGTATASFGIANDRWAVDAIGTLGRSEGQFSGSERSGYLRGELTLGPTRLAAALSGGSESFASWDALELGARYAPVRSFDVALTYRPELLDYVAASSPQLLHSMIADARLALSAMLDVALSAVGTTGADRDAFTLLASFAWRPLP